MRLLTGAVFRRNGRKNRPQRRMHHLCGQGKRIYNSPKDQRLLMLRPRWGRMPPWTRFLGFLAKVCSGKI